MLDTSVKCLKSNDRVADNSNEPFNLVVSTALLNMPLKKVYLFRCRSVKEVVHGSDKMCARMDRGLGGFTY